MKKYKWITLVIFLLSSSGLAAMDSLTVQKEERFQVGVTMFSVYNNFVENTNVGIGIFGNYKFPLFKKAGINGVAQLGLDRLLGCGGICESQWYESPFWFGAGVNKDFNLTKTKREDFSITLGVKAFGLSKADSWLFDPSTGERQYTYIEEIRPLYGVKLGYKIPVSLPISLSLSFDTDYRYKMYSFQLGWRF